jgi:hypothetical protein
MRWIAACALATLLGATATYAANTPSSATQPASTASSTSTTSTTSTTHATKGACEKEAMAKKLYGKAHDDYVKACEDGKKQ